VAVVRKELGKQMVVRLQAWKYPRTRPSCYPAIWPTRWAR
jgi:hypothetical protein